MNKLFEFIIEKPILTLFVIVVIFITLSFGIFKIHIDNEILHWFPKDSEISKLNYYINEVFESSNPIIVMIESKEDIMEISNLIHIRRISREVKEIEGIVDTISITEIEDVKSTEEEMIVEKLFPEEINNQDEILKIKKYVMSKEAYKSSLISKDGKSCIIIIQPSPNSRSDLLARDVREFIEKYKKENNLDWKIYFGGSPMILNSITKLVIKDISILVPIVSVVVFLVLFISFRNLKDTFLPLITVLISTACAIGIMGYLGLPLTTFGVGIPVVLIAVGNAYGIHLINEYHEKKIIGNINTTLEKVLKRIFIPIMMSALTTFGGFISIGIGNEMLSAKTFGYISSIGVLFSFIFTIALITPILKLSPSRKSEIANFNEESEHKLFMWWAKIVYKYKKLIIITFVTVGIICLYFLTKIEIRIDYLSYFDKDTEPRIVATRIGESFDGIFELKIYTSGNALDPIYLRTLQIIEEEIRFEAGSTSRPSSIVSIISYLNEGITRVPMIPENQNEVENLYFFIDGKENIKRLINYDKTETLILFLLPRMDSKERYKIVEASKKLLNEYQNVEIQDKSKSEKEIKKLIFKMIVNRIKRANIELDQEKINEFINSIPIINEFRNYEERFKYLNEISSRFYEITKISETQISKNDIMYSLSPLVWNSFILPKGQNQVFTKSGVAGLMKIFTDVEQILLRNQLVSLGLIILVVLLLLTVTFKSFFDSLISLVPIIFTIIVNFGIMGLFNINMDFVTVAIASIAAGIGIDYTIHYISRYIHELKNGKNYEEAFYSTFTTTGKGIMFNSLSVGLGFGVLIFSSIIPLRNFGTLMLVTMLVSSFSAMTILPSLLIYLRKYFLKSVEKQILNQ